MIKWIKAITDRLRDELPYEEDNEVILKAISIYLQEDVSRCKEFIGTKIIEEGYFNEIN